VIEEGSFLAFFFQQVGACLAFAELVKQLMGVLSVNGHRLPPPSRSCAVPSYLRSYVFVAFFRMGSLQEPRKINVAQKNGRAMVGDILCGVEQDDVKPNKGLLFMTVRENVHQIVDTLPDERLEDVLDCLAELSEPDEPLSGATRAALEEGLNDIRNGRTIALEEFRRTRRL
jgi:hypothetical protein